MTEILLSLNELITTNKTLTIDDLKKEFIWWLIIEHNELKAYVEKTIQKQIQIQATRLPRLMMRKMTNSLEITYNNFELFLKFIQELISKNAFSNERNFKNYNDFLNSFETSNFYINGKNTFKNLNKFKNNSDDALLHLLNYISNNKQVLLFGPFEELVQFEKYFKKFAKKYNFNTELSVNKFKSNKYNINYYSFYINMVVAEKYLEQTGLVLFIWPMNGAGSSNKQDPGFYNVSGRGSGTIHRDRTEQFSKDKFRKLCSKLMKCYNDYDLKQKLLLFYIFQTSISLFIQYELITNFEEIGKKFGIEMNKATFNFKVRETLEVESVNDNIEFGLHLDKTMGKNRQFFIYNIEGNTIPIPPITTLEFFKLCELTGVRVLTQSEIRDIISKTTKEEKIEVLNTNFIYQSLQLFELFIFSNPAQNIVQPGGGSWLGRRRSRQQETTPQHTEEQIPFIQTNFHNTTEEQETNILNDENYRKLVPCFITRNQTAKPTIMLIPHDLLLNANEDFVSIYVRQQTPIINFIFGKLDEFLKEDKDNDDILNEIYENLESSFQVSLRTIIGGGKKNNTKKSKKYIRTKLNSYTKNSLIKFNRKHKLKFKNLKKNELIDEIIRNLK